MALSKRLQAIASILAEHANDLLDIGYDHGLLMQWASQHGIQCVGGVEVSEQFEKQFMNRFDSSPINFYTGSGFTPVTDRHYQTVVIAGLGEERIREIIHQADKTQLDACEHLVFCPSSTDLRLRPFLNARGWYMFEEQIVEERDRYYVISHAMRGSEVQTDQMKLKIGPRLFDGSDPLLEKYLLANQKRFKYTFNQH